MLQKEDLDKQKEGSEKEPSFLNKNFMKKLTLSLLILSSIQVNSMQLARKQAIQKASQEFATIARRVEPHLIDHSFKLPRALRAKPVHRVESRQPYIKTPQVKQTPQNFSRISSAEFKKHRTDLYQKIHPLEKSLLQKAFKGDLSGYLSWKQEMLTALKGKGIFSLLEYYEHKLTSIGLTEEESKIYQTLQEKVKAPRRYHEFTYNKYKALKKRRAAQKLAQHQSSPTSDSTESIDLPTENALAHLHKAYQATLPRFNPEIEAALLTARNLVHVREPTIIEPRLLSMRR